MSDNILEKAAASGTVLSPLVSPGDMTAQGNSGDDGGVLNPEQSRQFIDYIFDEMVLANDGRRVVMKANTMEVDKVRVGSRLVAKATQAEQTGSNSAPAFTKIELTTTKFRLDYELSTESLEDNIEGQQLEDHIVRLMATQFGNDLEDIAINGRPATSGEGTYNNTLAGFIRQTLDTSYTGAHEAAAAAATMTSIWEATPDSGDGSVATSFVFKAPVYLEGGQEYCVCLASNSTKYSVYICRIGENDLLTQTFISNYFVTSVAFH